MPGWIVFFVELLLDVRSDILFDVVLFQGLSCDVNWSEANKIEWVRESSVRQ